MQPCQKQVAGVPELQIWERAKLRRRQHEGRRSIVKHAGALHPDRPWARYAAKGKGSVMCDIGVSLRGFFKRSSRFSSPD